MSIEFLVTALIVVAVPGAGALYTVATGLARGRRASLVAAFGCTIAILPHIAAAITGLAALLHTSALAFQLLKYAGILYLLYLAWQTLRARGALQLDTGGAKESQTKNDRQIVGQAILINLLNPKLSIFFLAFLPQFVPAGATDGLARMVQLSAVFMALTFVVFAFYGMFAAATRHYVLSRPSVMGWLRRGIAATFVGLGARLALAER
ncbi:LysE family translocator [Rhodovibrio salinarum]|uniref:LysE family translocator n=1 Tax=Rhodovibrio salinarum TaxID=1087 RepID=A0A934QIY2_9PROT|nr:LysE family translocator [Rhodovibrio salinarum]MBK1697836.1 LysE family translocator [Rhodovibrio salinarum]